MREVWFTEEDLEEILWLDSSQIESWLIEDGQILSEERSEPWAVDLAYMDRLVLTMISRLPDRAAPPHDDAASLLLRYALALIEKKKNLHWRENGRPALKEVQSELADWEARIRPLLKLRRNGFRRTSPLPMLTSLVEVR